MGVSGAVPKPPLRPGHVWSIRTKLKLERRTRDLAMFNLAIDSKLRGCDLVAVGVSVVQWVKREMAAAVFHGRRGLWLLIGTTLALFWPVMFGNLCLICNLTEDCMSLTLDNTYTNEPNGQSP